MEMEDDPILNYGNCSASISADRLPCFHLASRYTAEPIEQEERAQP